MSAVAVKNNLKPQECAKAFDRIVYQTLRPGAVGLAILYLIFGVAHWNVLPPGIRLSMALLAFTSAAVFLVLWALLRNARFENNAHAIAAGMALIVLTNCLMHMHLTQSPHETINLVLLTVGLGEVFLLQRWFYSGLVVIWGGFWLVIWMIGKSAPAFPLDYGLLSATVIACILHVARRRIYGNLEDLRCQNNFRKEILEEALKAAEHEIEQRRRIESDLQRAQSELELRVQQRTAELEKVNQALRLGVEEREKAEAALRKSEAGLVLAQKIGRVGSWELDLKTEALYWSAETYRIFGLTQESVIPTRTLFSEMVHRDDRNAVSDAVTKAIQNKNTYSIDHRIIQPDGSERVVCEHAGIMLDENGNAKALVGTVQDITDRKLLEDQVRHFQKMEAVGQLAAGIAHDFNNILTIVLGHARILQDSSLKKNEQEEIIVRIIDAGERATNLTRQLLMFSKKQPIQLRALALGSLIDGMISMFGRILGEDIVLRVELDSELPLIEADRGMIEQIIMNLLVNSRDAMPRGGEILLKVSCTHTDKPFVERNPEAREGDFVCLRVQDTGVGIKPELLPRIFEPFFSTKAVGRGTGLGLSIVYGLVKQHNGWIEVSSELGKGTQFAMYFPITREQQLNKAEISESTSVKTGNETILVVEDEPTVRQLACRLLRRQGFRVLEAESGAAAIDVWRKHSEEVDLLLTDLVMPGGVSGRELAERCLEEKSTLRIVYTSGYSDEFSLLDLSERKGVTFLPKPYQLASLSKAIRDSLDS